LITSFQADPNPDEPEIFHRNPAVKRGAGAAKIAKKTFRKTSRPSRLRGKNPGFLRKNLSGKVL
jgi:hypothetical protein